MKKNIILNLLIIIIIVCCGLGIYFILKNGLKVEKWTQEPQETIVVEKQAIEEVLEETKEEKPTEAEEEDVEQPLDRQIIMSYIVSHISSLVREIAPEKCSCGDWKVTRFGFTSDEDTYVEYEHNGELARILVYCTGTTKDVRIDVQALFEPGADMWNLVKGEDTQFGKRIEFYEQNEQGEWVSIHKR